MSYTKTDKMDPKNYAKYDRQFMAFGSIMNGLQGLISQQKPDEVKAIILSAWNTSRELVNGLVDELYLASENNSEDVPF